MKSILQELWKSNKGWDDPLPTDIHTRWEEILQELPLLESVSIPRYILSDSWFRAQLIGFSDASSLGMGAVLYVRLETHVGISTHILKSKTKVAPLHTWTIPRLELGAACLLAKLIRTSLPISSTLSVDRIICFSDSTTVLSWIRTPPYLLKMFVSNRVTQILDDCSNASWRHVCGEDNAADPASRGLLPSQLIASSMWWHGPDFLCQPLELWPAQPSIDLADLPEIKKPPVVSLAVVRDTELFNRVMERSSSLLKSQRILAYVVRFLYNLIRKHHKRPKSEWLFGPVTAAEYREALSFMVEVTQRHYFSKEFEALQAGRPCSKNLWSLTPFVTSTGYLRVGGRLSFSLLPPSSKHPFLIPRESHLARLLCDHYHVYSGHGGPKLVQSLVMRTYWIPSIKSLIRQRIFRCLTCFKESAKPTQPQMADLPAQRVTPARCFTHTGVDFGGPYHVRMSSKKNPRYEKVYIALFVCMVTKAIHLEIATSLSEETCLACLDRFIARRGLPTHIYSDQGSNFRGAARELNGITRSLQKVSPAIAHYLAQREISWIFNPPYSPHFGGLWDGGIKSVKKHLRRIIGDQCLTIEEFVTVLTRVEAILNSRPLAELPNSPTDGFDTLTPGHFLVGGPLLARPEEDLLDLPANRLSRWQLTRRLAQSFWQTWMKDYLHTQLHRPKWTQPSKPIQEGDLVLWHKPQLPPTQWPLGRIAQVLPGKDGTVRVVRIQTPHGVETRSTHKVIPLPFDN